MTKSTTTRAQYYHPENNERFIEYQASARRHMIWLLPAPSPTPPPTPQSISPTGDKQEVQERETTC
jgi:hypothetical protein